MSHGEDGMGGSTAFNVDVVKGSACLLGFSNYR